MRLMTFALASLLALAAAPAQAIVFVTLTGTIGTGSDAGGLGVAGASASTPINLANKAFTLEVQADPETFGAEGGLGPYGLDVRGFGSANPIQNALLTIEGASYDFSPGEYGLLLVQDGFPTPASYDYLSGRAGALFNAGSSINFGAYLFNDVFIGPQTILPVYTLVPPLVNQPWGDFSIVGPNGQTVTARGSLNIQTISAGAAAASAPVPEPTTWAMMICGFVLVGGALRLRRRRAALAHA